MITSKNNINYYLMLKKRQAIFIPGNGADWFFTRISLAWGDMIKKMMWLMTGVVSHWS